MTHEFEDPRKAELRLRAEAAIEAAGHVLLPEPVPIDYPPETNLRGRIRGDIQSTDGDNQTHVYFVRPDPDRPLPEWIRSTVGASHGLDNVLVHVVVPRTSDVIEDGARLCGAGLLVATEDIILDQILVPGPPDPGDVLAETIARGKDLRRLLDTKARLNIDANQARFNTVAELTEGMAPNTREKYVEGLERTDRLWADWSEDVAADIDRAVSEQDMDALDLVEAAIAAGPLFDDEDHESVGE